MDIKSFAFSMIGLMLIQLIVIINVTKLHDAIF